MFNSIIIFELRMFIYFVYSFYDMRIGAVLKTFLTLSVQLKIYLTYKNIILKVNPLHSTSI